MMKEMEELESSGQSRRREGVLARYYAIQLI